MKTDLFQCWGYCGVFHICWHIECNTFMASSFRIWNSSTGIPSPPLALSTVMLPKAHLTSHSRISGSSLVITPSWLSGSWRSFFFLWISFLYSSSLYSCYLFLISSASFRSTPFLSFIVTIFAWNILLVSLALAETKIYVNDFLTVSSVLSIIHYPSEKMCDLGNLLIQFPHFIDKEIDTEGLSETHGDMVVQSRFETRSPLPSPESPLLPRWSYCIPGT